LLNPLQQLCIELARSGTQPSVSLLRAKCSSKVTLPEAINTIQWWQQDQEALLATATSNASAFTSTHTNDDQIAHMKQQIEQIEVQLASLKQQLIDLERQTAR
jgi:hypothetical protein